MRALLIIVIVLLVMGGIVYVTKSPAGTAAHGALIPSDAKTIPIGKILKDAKASDGKLVAVEGKITEKCPTSGCWFYLQDPSGKIRVDTAPSNFTIQDVPTGASVKVYGRVSLPEEGDPEITATGVR